MKMEASISPGIHDLEQFREKRWVFRDRTHAGKVLAGMLEPYGQGIDLILSIPAGGVPVGSVVAEKLNLPFDVAVVSKITLPWNTEAGYGAVAFDGTLRLNDTLLFRLNLSESDIQKGVEKTKEKVEKRVSSLRGSRPFPNLTGASVVLIDDGLASGFTMKVAVDALKNLNTQTIIVAVPTAHKESMDLIRSDVQAIFCPNVRSGWRYAVAEAYESWHDVDESEVMRILNIFSAEPISKSQEPEQNKKA